MGLGIRQFPNEWWPATLLYTIDYENEEARVKLQPLTPLSVQLKRDRIARASSTPNGQAVEVNDKLVVARLEGGEGRSISSRLLLMRLQTMRNRDGYWLDTGILVDV
jgi:hypothetical protein